MGGRGEWSLNPEITMRLSVTTAKRGRRCTLSVGGARTLAKRRRKKHLSTGQTCAISSLREKAEKMERNSHWDGLAIERVRYNH